ncbi:MAG: hypothetical protein WDO71_12110 [Bacteroidota bacterium]
MKPGKYQAQASIVGLKTQSREVEVKDNELIILDFILEENATQLQVVLVTANPGRYVTDYPSISLRLKTPLIEIPQNIRSLQDKHCRISRFSTCGKV